MSTSVACVLGAAGKRAQRLLPEYVTRERPRRSRPSSARRRQEGSTKSSGCTAWTGRCTTEPARRLHLETRPAASTQPTGSDRVTAAIWCEGAPRTAPTCRSSRSACEFRSVPVERRPASARCTAAGEAQHRLPLPEQLLLLAKPGVEFGARNGAARNYADAQ